MTKKQVVAKLVELEEDYNLLSGDAIWQEDLFELQPKLADIMVNLANDTGYPLGDVLPYLFTTKKE